MQINQVIPVLRIFDYRKAIEFYVDWLGFKIDWEHTFEENTPIYLQISLGNLVLHLSEHHGDASPGANVFVRVEGIRAFHQQLLGKKYKYNKPGINETLYGTVCVTVNDPFYNKISFNEDISKEIADGF